MRCARRWPPLERAGRKRRGSLGSAAGQPRPPAATIAGPCHPSADARWPAACSGQFAEYEAVYPGAARWILEEAAKNAAHAREMERRAIKLQRLDTTLHRLLPFALVLAFLIASVVVTFVSPIVGGAGLFATMAGVLIAYLTGRVPNVQPPEDRPTSQ
jgi:uncharacterized membrane protein